MQYYMNELSMVKVEYLSFVLMKP